MPTGTDSTTLSGTRGLKEWTLGPADMPNIYRLADLPFDEAVKQLMMFDSYGRTEALAFLMERAPSPSDCVRAFLDSGNMCDAPWLARFKIADLLRRACSQVVLRDLLDPDARRFYDALPQLVPVWRGCEQWRQRGLSWTTDRTVAEGFAKGKRHINKAPTLVHAEIPKQHIFAVFVCRNESEIVLDPRRLRKLKAVPTQGYTFLSSSPR
jgi:hypothetical protein